MVIKTLSDTNTALFGLCLFDSGSTSTLINVHAVSPHIKPKSSQDQQITTTEGIYSSNEYILMLQKYPFQISVKCIRSLSYIYVHSIVIRHGTISE